MRRTVDEAARLSDVGRFAEAWAALEPILEREGSGTLPAARVATLLEAVRALVPLGRAEDALPRALRALALAESHGLLEEAAASLLRLGYVHQRRGDAIAARNAYEEALARFRRLGDENGVAAARNNLGLVLKNLGEWIPAEGHLAAAADHARRTGKAALAASRSLNLAVLRLKRGDAQGAAAPLEEARAGHARAAHAWGRATGALAAGWKARLERRFADAERELQQALELALSEGLPREEAIALEFLADVALERARPAVAVSLLARALRLATPAEESPDLACEIQHRLAAAHLAEGRHGDARGALDAARALAERLHDPYESARVDLVAAELAHAEGDAVAERAALEAAIVRLDALAEWRERGRALARLAVLEADAERARALAFEAHHLARRTGDLSALARLAGAFPGLEPGTRPPSRRTSGDARTIPPVRLVGACPAIARARELVAHLARSSDPVLVLGESGTGKDETARAIHAGGQGRPEELVIVDAAQGSGEEFREGLAAVTRRPRRGPAATTLYIDRLDELDACGQRALLEFLDHAGTSLRLIAAASPALRAAVDRGSFRSELFYRLQGTSIPLPPLRDRGEDVVLLAEAFLADHAARPTRLEPETRRILARHDWPGNVRELKHLVALAATLATGSEAEALSSALLEQVRRTIDAVPPPVPPASWAAVGGATPADPDALRHRLRELERGEIEESLRRTSGNRSRAARLLRVSRKTLYARMRRLGIAPPPREN